MDGDIWISFNQAGVDTEIETGKSGKGFWYKKASMFKIKEAGQPVKFPQDTVQELTKKIYQYTGIKEWLDIPNN